MAYYFILLFNELYIFSVVEIFKKNITEMIRQVGTPVYKNGILVKGVMIRHIKSPLNIRDDDEISAFLTYYDKLIKISILDNFVDLES